MAITMYKEPLHKLGPVGQDWVWSFLSTNATQPKFRYIVDIRIHTTTAVGAVDVRLKISPGAFNIGTVNLREILEQNVSSDNHININSPYGQFKGTQISYANGYFLPIHLVDNFTMAQHSTIHFGVYLGEEYASASNQPAVEYTSLLTRTGYTIFNGVVPNRGQRYAINTTGRHGVDVCSTERLYGGPYVASKSNPCYFLTNAPLEQYCREDDYMTVATLSSFIKTGQAAKFDRVVFEFPNGNDYAVMCNSTNGGRNGSSDTSIKVNRNHMHYIGIGPANQWANATFQTNYVLNDFYKVALYDGGQSTSSNRSSQYYTIYKGEDDCKGYETIRLTWLNRHGAWDYYNFTKKSYRELEIKKEYLEGNRIKHNVGPTINSWNRTNSVFSTSAKEVIKANTDWVNDETAIWLEELFTSPEVYMIGQRIAADNAADSYQQDGEYVVPVIITNNKYERYTAANDKVAQYEVDIEVDDTISVQNSQSFLQKF